MNSPIQKTPVKLEIFISDGVDSPKRVTHDNTQFCNSVKFSFGQFVSFFVILCSFLLSFKCVPNDDHGGPKEVHVCALHYLKNKNKNIELLKV